MPPEQPNSMQPNPSQPLAPNSPRTSTRSSLSPAPITVDEFREQLAHLPLVLTLQQAARASGLSTATLRRRIASGELRRLKSRECRGGRLRVLRDDLARLLSTMSE